MGTKRSTDSAKKYEKAMAKEEDRKYLLRLYVTGTTPRSVRAIKNIERICNEHLKGRYDLEVVDIYQQPYLAEGDQIIAVPTLIKVLPRPLKRFIGDMSGIERVLLGLDVREKDHH